jgi:rhodanese-related sulfurtransferase
MSLPDPVEQSQRAPLRLSRRGLVVLGGAAIVTGGAVAAQWYNILGENGADALDPQQAYEAVREGALVLVDVRRPNEWASTGVGDGAVPLDMRRSDFEAALLEVVSGDTAQPIALICARGVRSRRMTERLKAAGFTRIIDVPEGMLGSGAGPGWLGRELPVVDAPL